MWTTLNSCKHLKFYQDFDRQSQNLFAGPMQRAVEYLQTLPEAKDLFAFTSHAHFQVTTSPSIADDEDHFFVGLIYDSARSEYRIYMKLLSEGWASDPDNPTYFPPADLHEVASDFIGRLTTK